MGLLASDNFNRANENPLGNGVWTTASGNVAMQIVSNQATPTDLSVTNNGSYYSGISWPADQYSKAKLTVNSTGGGTQGPGLFVRQQSGADTKYMLVIDHAATNNVAIVRVSAGVFTTLTGFPITQAWTDGDTWELRVVGAVLSIRRNGVQIGPSVSDSNIVNGSPGIGLSTAVTSAAIDDWEGGFPDTNAPLLGSLLLKSAQGASLLRVLIRNHSVSDIALVNNISLTADFGSLIFTGFAPSLDQKINASLGALTLTGFAPSLDQQINAALGQLVLTGFAPSLDNKINAAVGQLVLNGFAASPVIGTNLIAQLGALDLTGFAPTVDVTNNVSILAGLGQLLIDGFAPEITGQDTTQVAGTGPTGDRRMALMEELRELQQTLAQEKEPQHKGFRDDRVAKRRKQIESALLLEQKREAAKLAAEVAAENEDEEGLLSIILNFLGGSDVS